MGQHPGKGRIARTIPMPRHDRSESRLARPVGCPPPPVSSEAYVAGVAVVSAVLGRLANAATSRQDGLVASHTRARQLCKSEEQRNPLFWS